MSTILIYIMKNDITLLSCSGDNDLVVPHISTENWISILNLTVNEDWRAWFVDGQIAVKLNHHYMISTIDVLFVFIYQSFYLTYSSTFGTLDNAIYIFSMAL
ncbi:hypothetical protein ACOSP7_004294 [Xanthoceras sorbifolium]